jgi:VIT1/CCC1 family predicted Fe2+/Mn2+ transporter
VSRSADDRKLREHLATEVDSSFLYETLAGMEEDAQIAEVYRRLARTERGHAEAWLRRQDLDPATTPLPEPSRRAHILGWLARRFGPQLVLPTLIDTERADAAALARAGGSGPANQSHARVLDAVRRATTGGVEGGFLARIEGRHHGVGGNALRAAVLGANDGLVSNLSLVMGVAGASGSQQAVLVAGTAGLLAGAISMALGEWLSVQSSRELFERQIEIEMAELEAAPEEEAEELALIYESKGLGAKEARELAGRIVANEAVAVDTLAREELGIDPADLGGSAWVAAGTSFGLFALGAIVPLVPFLVTSGAAAVAASAVASALALFVVGAAITLLTGRSVMFSGSRQTAFGLAAAALTYGIGWLMGVTLAG